MSSPATATHYTTEDYKKYIFAEGRAYITRIGDVIEALNEHHDLDQENYEDLTCMLDQAICYLKRAAFADYDGQPLRTVEEVSTFDDGRPISTTVHFDEEEGDQYIEHAWHPDPNHPVNQVGAWHEYSWGPVPFRYRHIEITGPGAFTVHKEEDLEAEREAELAGLSDDELRVHFAYQIALDTNRPHRTHSDMAKQLGMTREKIDVVAEKLTERGLLNNAWGRLTENHQHVLNEGKWLWSNQPKTVLDALMTWGWQTPADELAQRLHMDLAEVEQHLRGLITEYDVR